MIASESEIQIQTPKTQCLEDDLADDSGFSEQIYRDQFALNSSSRGGDTYQLV